MSRIVRFSDGFSKAEPAEEVTDGPSVHRQAGDTDRGSGTDAGQVKNTRPFRESKDAGSFFEAAAAKKKERTFQIHMTQNVFDVVHKRGFACESDQ